MVRKDFMCKATLGIARAAKSRKARVLTPRAFPHQNQWEMCDTKLLERL